MSLQGERAGLARIIGRQGDDDQIPLPGGGI